MGYLAERVSYLRGLVDGISLDKSSPESRIFDEILELFEDIVTSVEAIDEKQDSLTEELEYTREDVDALYYDDEDFEDDEDGDEDDEEYEEEEYYDEFECPNCGEILPVDEALLDTEDEITLTCPGCGEKVTISFVDEEDEEDEEDEADGEDGEDEGFDCDGDCDNCPESDSEKF